MTDTMIQSLDATAYRQQLLTTGTASIEAGTLFTEQELAELDRLQRSLPEEHITLGDADEPNDVHVRRLLVDLPESLPEVVNGEAAERALALLGDARRQRFFEQLLGGPHYLRRCQVNRMTQGSFIGLHLDRDSNPDYAVSVVIQLGRRFGGGDFVVHREGDAPRAYRTSYGMVLVSDCACPHQVTTVTDEERVSLVYFYSANAGANKRSLAA